jgi:hypothetical protein
MNTGLHDVWNLVWKLDQVVRGHGNEQLLDSYTAERRPVIRQVIEMTDFLTRTLGTPSKLAQVLRDAVIPMVSHLAPFQYAFVQRLSELGVAYPGSPIVEGAGERYFADSLRGGAGILHRFLLIVGNDAEPPAKEAAKQLAGSFEDVVELRSGPGQQMTLVRPDGYVACAGRGREEAIESLRSVLERQTRPAGR